MNCVELEFIILHAKFHDHRTNSYVGKDFLKVFTIHGHGGHLGHVKKLNANFQRLLSAVQLFSHSMT